MPELLHAWIRGYIAYISELLAEHDSTTAARRRNESQDIARHCGPFAIVVTVDSRVSTRRGRVSASRACPRLLPGSPSHVCTYDHSSTRGRSTPILCSRSHAILLHQALGVVDLQSFVIGPRSYRGRAQRPSTPRSLSSRSPACRCRPANQASRRRRAVPLVARRSPGSSSPAIPPQVPARPRSEPQHLPHVDPERRGHEHRGHHHNGHDQAMARSVARPCNGGSDYRDPIDDGFGEPVEAAAMRPHLVAYLDKQCLDAVALILEHAEPHVVH